MRALLMLPVVLLVGACGAAAAPEDDPPVAKLFDAIHVELDSFDGRENPKELTSTICSLVDDTTLGHLLDKGARYPALKIVPVGSEGGVVLSYLRTRLIPMESKELRIAIDADGSCWAGAFLLSAM